MSNQEARKPMNYMPSVQERASTIDELGLLGRSTGVYNDPKGYSLEQAFKESGGFGKKISY